MRISKLSGIILYVMAVVMCPRTAMATDVPVPDEPKVTELDEVTVTRTKNKYTKKNNPAVDLMERIRREAPKHDPEESEYYRYNKYEKIVISLNDFSADKSKWLADRLKPIEDFIDTANITGKPVLNVSFREKRSIKESQRHPDKKTETVIGFRSGGVDETFDQENIQVMLEDVFREVDIYKNDITILQNRFVSPLSRIAADYYKFYIGDTVYINNRRCVELIFVPHNPESFSFNGSLYVAIADTTGFIPRVRMRVPKALNLNFVNNIFIEQDFERDFAGNRNKVSDRMSVEMQLVPGLQGFYISRESNYDGFAYFPDNRKIDKKRLKYTDSNTAYLEGYDRRDDAFWRRARIGRVKEHEKSVSTLSERIDNVPFLYWLRKGIELIVTGYIPTGNPSKFDIGPVNTMVSFNTVEGARFRLGGMTTAALSRHLFARGYGAYGTRDHRWKYNAELEYSFLPKKKHSREFPMHSIRIEHSYDLDMLGQHYNFTNSDNVFLSLKRRESNLDTYRRLTRLTYFYEHKSGLSVSAGLKQERQFEGPFVKFVNGDGIHSRHFDQSAFFIDVTFAPGAKFVQTASNRLPVNLDNWVISLSHEFGPKGFLGADFTLNKTDLAVSKRFWFSAFGYLDATLMGGAVWSKVQYPALPWANANLSYTIQPQSFALMNPMEFAVDRYGQWFMTYWANGALFNRIPGVNKLKLREVVTFNGMYGRLTHRNDPSLHPDLYCFPADANTKGMTGAPYMELGVGIDNILTILRVDYIWRLTHRNTPGAPDGGLRVSLHFQF